MLKIITKIELMSTLNQEEVFRRIPLVHPFGKLKTTTSREDAGELTTVNLTATVSRDDNFLHEPSIVRVTWSGGTATFGSRDYPVLFTITDDEKVELAVKYLSVASL